MKLITILAIISSFVVGCSDTSFNGSNGSAPKGAGPKIEESKKEKTNKSTKKSSDVKAGKNKGPIITSEPITTHDPGELLQDPKKFDLRTWQQVNFNTACGDKTPQWSIDQDFAYELHNAEASALISDIDSVGVQIEGTFSVANGGKDDDFIGFVFGFQDIQNTYLFDWKKAEQGQQPGMCLQALEFTRPIQDCDLFLGRNGYAQNNVRVIECANTIPWQVGIEYTYVLNFRPGNIEITIKNGDQVLDTIKSKDEKFTSGKFGLYANSQDKASFRTPTVAPVKGDDYKYQVDAEDPDGDAISFKLEKNPDGMTIDSETGEIFWKASDKVSGTHAVEVVVTDEHGASTTQAYELVIEAD